ncbi:hypothetical protein HAX54_005425 [Datura stramonium]|uniref:Uncharacterized protein n=1 Tax=Datura stramonium TaxID=4076 RepID=A0ABS8RUS0_DATST|nr:hypothetical protein [Datura stramonium]
MSILERFGTHSLGVWLDETDGGGELVGITQSRFDIVERIKSKQYEDEFLVNLRNGVQNGRSEEETLDLHCTHVRKSALCKTQGTPSDPEASPKEKSSVIHVMYFRSFQGNFGDLCKEYMQIFYFIWRKGEILTRIENIVE